MSELNAWGIDERYRDEFGHWHEVPRETKDKFLSVMRAGQPGQPDPPGGGVIVLRHGHDHRLPHFSEIVLEDGARVTRESRASVQLPLGYHTFRDAHGHESRLIVAPAKCYLPPDLHTWGWALQLYSLRSESSWGMGDLEDLRRAARWSAELGAGTVMVNPLCATAPVLPQEASPYYPSSRLFLNPLYLRIEEIDGALEAVRDLNTLFALGQELNLRPLIERDAIFRLKMQALESLWLQVRDTVALEAFEPERRKSLQRFATFCAFAERHGANWRAWPEQFRDPEKLPDASRDRELSDRIRFHQWLQLLLDQQLQEASSAGNIMQDLPVGVSPDGADAWMWQGVMATGVSVGSPPDMFNTHGQDWGLPPFVPHKLRAAGYQPFVETLRAGLRYACGLRIDHVMALFRLFWIPVGAPSAHGTYVRYNAEEMLSILALESVRAKSFIVGEDLGTVDAGVREKLAEYAVLSYKLLWFEERAPEHYPKLALAAVSTHDLPTIAGLWCGADFEEQESAGLEPKRENSERIRKNLKQAARVEDGAALADVIVETHEALARSPAVITMASMEDAVGAERRPNLPGAANHARPNWCIPLPKTLEQIEKDPAVLKIAACLNNRKQRA